MYPLNEIEKEGAIAAGMAMGQYLDTFGQTDLAKLTEEQFNEICFIFARNFMAFCLPGSRENT